MSAANYTDTMKTSRQRDWHKVRRNIFVLTGAFAFVLMFEQVGNPLSLAGPVLKPVLALLLLTVLFIYRQKTLKRRAERSAVSEGLADSG
ncbi:hypothetical protein [Candidatus Poriferisodalis sp.]|uniref:hypothetical protein n=1 Tax=Candidatus Poriferisodalis sp. TaxID=3101277 RepID=UPI003B01A73E